MLLSKYETYIVKIIQQYVDEGWILSYSFSMDCRSNYIGFIQGKLEFIKGSKLFFKEYVDVQKSVEKLSYSFHYQDQENNLIFRYDNAKHKPDLGYTNHKHIKTKIIPSQIPNIEEIISEIIKDYLDRRYTS